MRESASSTFSLWSRPAVYRTVLALLALATCALWFSSRAVLSANFLPHWYCLAGDKPLLWTTVIADLFIGLSYVAISATLAAIVRRAGRDLPYQGFFWAFGVFIVSCGVTHFLEVVTVWKPLYWLAAAAKVVTAVTSILTALILVLAAEDIAQFVRTARQLAARRGDAKFRALINASPQAVLSFDLRDVISSWNPSAQRIFGYAEEEVVGKSSPIVPAAFREEHLQILRNTCEGLTTASLETRRQRRDGVLIPVSLSAAPLHDEHGIRVGGVLTIEDISERKHLELDLTEKTGMLSAVTQALNIYLESGWNQASRELLAFAVRRTNSELGFLGVVLDDGAIRVLAQDGTSWEETIHRQLYEDALRGYREHSAMDFRGLRHLFTQVILSGQIVTSNHAGEPCSDGLPPGLPPLHSFLGVPILRGHEVAGVIGVANRAGGYTGQEWVSLEAMSQATGVLCDNYRQGLKRDALEQKQTELEAQFRHSQKMEVLGRLAGGVAHDFNNMLMVLSGSAELLDRALPPDALSRVYLDQIQRSVTKAAAITRQLLAFSRKQILDIRPMDLHAALHESRTILLTLLGSDIRVDLQPSAARSWIRSDLSQIEQVIVNLAINARDAMPSGGQLTISTRNTADPPPTLPAGSVATSDWTVLDVADNGQGMTRQVLAQIFEPFFTTKPAGKGTGLGLATVYGIVRQSGGYIHVESAPGKGSCFSLYFPTIVPPQPAEPPVHGPTVSRSTVSATLLLVDDEASLRHAIGEILRDSGYTVLEAADSQSALHLAREHPGAIDLLVTDVVMPGMRGPELHRNILASQPRIQVLFISGYAEDLPETQLPPGARFLQKPFSFSALLENLRQLYSIDHH